MRWVFVGGLALSCGGSTGKHGDRDVATGGEPEPTAGGSVTASSAGDVAEPGVGGAIAARAGASVGANGGAPETGGGAGEPAVGGEAGAPPDTFDATCPATLPAPRGGCAFSLSCDYGMDPRPWCRPSARCEAGRWQVETPFCVEPAVCENIGGFGDGQTCEPPAQPDPCRNEDSQLCNCVGNTWRCNRSDLTYSACPQPIPPNDGQPCPFQGYAPEGYEYTYDCYYRICSEDPGFYALTCGATGWQKKATCGF